MSREDMSILAERVGSLQEENKRLKNDLEAMTLNRNWAQRRVYWDSWWKGVAIAVLAIAASLFVFGGLGWIIYSAIMAPDGYTHCRIESDQVYGDLWVLRGNLEWREDVTIGAFCKIEEAESVAEQLNCPIRGQ